MSITLTVPAQINSVLGGNVLIDYDHVVLTPITINQVTNVLSASVRLTSSVNPEMDVITGNLNINAGTGTLLFTVEQLDMVRKMQLSAGQITAVLSIMSNAQDALENGLINISVIDGTQATGN